MNPQPSLPAGRLLLIRIICAVIVSYGGGISDGQESRMVNGQRAGVSATELAAMSESPAGLTLIKGRGLRLHGDVIGVLEGTSDDKRITIVRLRGTADRYIHCLLRSFEPKSESLMDRHVVIEGDVAGLSEAIGLDGRVTYLSVRNCRVIEPDLATLPVPAAPQLPPQGEYEALIKDPARRTCGQVFCAFERQIRNGSILPMSRTKDLTVKGLTDRYGGTIASDPPFYSVDWQARGAMLPLRGWETLCGPTKAVPLQPHGRNFSQSDVDNLHQIWNEELWEIPYECHDGVLYIIGARRSMPGIGDVFEPRKAMMLLKESR